MSAKHILEDRSPRWERQNPCRGSKTENQTLMCTRQMNENRSPSIWRGRLPWRFCKTSLRRMIIPWYKPFPLFLLFLHLEDHLNSYRKRKPVGFLGGVEGMSYNGRGSRFPFMHPSNSGGGSVPLLPPHRGAGNSINQPLPNYQLTN